MGIKPCKECGSPVSDKAESCPACGFKQPKPTSRVTWLFLIAVICFAVMWVVESGKESTQPISKSQNTSEHSSENVDMKELSENWLYKTSKDDMRNLVTKFASTVSTNSVDFDFPYNGGSSLILTLRKKGDEIDVIVSVTKGQILCSVRGCEVAFKFDDKPVKSITMSEPDNHSSDTLFVQYDKTELEIISQLKNSKKLIIEVPFYREGRKQFTFDVTNLEWND